MLPTLDLGPLVIPTGGLTYLLGVWLALMAIERAAARLQLHVAATYGVAVTALASGFVGARLVFVALHWDAYSENLLGIVWPLTSGFNLWAGLLIGLAGGFFYGRAKALPPLRTLDALAPGILITLMAISLGDFLAGPGFGVEADLPWSVSLFGVRRHPVQLYELGLGLLALGTWLWALRREAYLGQLFLASIAVYCGGRLLLDSFRANAWVSDGGYHVLQIICLLVTLVSLFFLGQLAEREVAVEE